MLMRIDYRHFRLISLFLALAAAVHAQINVSAERIARASTTEPGNWLTQIRSACAGA